MILGSLQLSDRLELTKKVLYSISYHLSRNKDSKSQIYRVIIEEAKYTDIITLETDATFCFCTGGKRTKRKISAIHHIIFNHFPDLQEFAMQNNRFEIKRNTLEHGIYEYRPSITGKNRRWFKIG